MSNKREPYLVPINWAAAAFVTLLGPAIAATMWVKGVNDWMVNFDHIFNKRMARVERRLGIDTQERSTLHSTDQPLYLENPANANQGGDK
jgi:hypothetical protein